MIITLCKSEQKNIADDNLFQEIFLKNKKTPENLYFVVRYTNCHLLGEQSRSLFKLIQFTKKLLTLQTLKMSVT